MMTASLALLVALQGPAAVTVERRLFLMGTTATVMVEAPTRNAALAAAEAAVRALEAAEARLSTWREDSELAALNRAPVGAWHPLSSELAEELQAAVRCRDASDGAFDPALAPLVRAWGLRHGARRPGPEELAAAREAIGAEAFEVGLRAARRLHPGAGLEEGAFGKGAALDRALVAARAGGATAARIDLGGQLSFFSQPPRAWDLAASHPRLRSRPAVALTVGGGSVATSGNSERAGEVNGEPLGHLLDPRTGRPAPATGSVTVWAENGLWADCLATAFFVLGPQASLARAAALPGVELLWLEEGEGDTVQARATRGWVDRPHALTAEVVITGPAGEDLAPSARHETRSSEPLVWHPAGPLLPGPERAPSGDLP